MESDLPPTSYSVSEELHLHSLIQYMLHWQLMRMRVLQKEDLEKKKHVISRYRTCDLLTWSQQLLREHFTSNSHAKSDGYKHTNRKFCTQLPSVGLAQARPN